MAGRGRPGRRLVAIRGQQGRRVTFWDGYKYSFGQTDTTQRIFCDVAVYALQRRGRVVRANPTFVSQVDCSVCPSTMTALGRPLRSCATMIKRRSLELMREQMPWRTRAHDPAQRAESVRIGAAVGLRSSRSDKERKSPLFIRYIRRVWFAFGHPTRFPCSDESA